MKKDCIDAYVALSVSGSRVQTVFGIAVIAYNQKRSSVGVARHGTRLIRLGYVLDVVTNGAGPPACAAVNGLCT
jgi:hypothetical protein